MNSRLKRLIVVMILLLVISSCGKAATDDGRSADDSDPEHRADSRKAVSGQDSVNDAAITDDSRKTPVADDIGAEELSVSSSDIRQSVRIGSEQEEIRSFLGEPTEVVRAVLDDSTAWRYDFEPATDYSYSHELDIPDVPALQNADVAMQLFIYWNDESQSIGYSLYEAENDGDIHVYHLLENGTVTEETM